MDPDQSAKPSLSGRRQEPADDTELGPLSTGERIASVVIAPLIALADAVRWFSDGMFRTAEKLDPLALAGRLLTKIAPAARWLWERIKKLLIRVKLFLDRIRERIYVFLAPVFRRIYPAYQTVHRFIASLWAPTMAVLTRIATRVRIAALPIVRLIRRLFRRPRAMLAAASAFVSKLVAQTRVRMKRVSGR